MGDMSGMEIQGWYVVKTEEYLLGIDLLATNVTLR